MRLQHWLRHCHGIQGHLHLFLRGPGTIIPDRVFCAHSINLGPGSRETLVSESTACPASRTSSNFGVVPSRTTSLTLAQTHLLAASRSNTLTAQVTYLKSFSIDKAIDEARIDEKYHDLLTTPFSSSYDPPVPSTISDFAKNCPW